MVFIKPRDGQIVVRTIIMTMIIVSFLILLYITALWYLLSFIQRVRINASIKVNVFHPDARVTNLRVLEREI